MILGILIGLVVDLSIGGVLVGYLDAGYCRKLEARHFEDKVRLRRLEAEAAQRGEVS